jgi:hypothetical protein
MARIGGFSVNNNNNQVYLNVYDLHENNAMLYPWGLGFYHSGVQIGRDEYTFGKSFVVRYFLYSYTKLRIEHINLPIGFPEQPPQQESLRIPQR